MTNSTSLRFLSHKILVLFLGAAALALASGALFAQHGGGGHANGGGAGARPSGGGGGNFSPPPTPRAPSQPAVRPPAPHFAPPVVAMPPHIPVYTPVVHPTPTPAPPASSQPVPVTGFRVAPLGHAPASSNEPINSALPGIAIGTSRRFVGDGHQIWSEPTRTAALPTAGSTSTTTGRVLRGPAGLAPATTSSFSSSHIMNFPPGRFRGPIIFGSGFGNFGYGYPYYFGSPFGYGSPFFFGNPLFGFQFGSVWVPCNGFGPGLQCAPFNYDYGYDSSYNSVVSGGMDTDTTTESQQIYSPYSPALPPAEENTNGPSPDEYLLYLKDGSLYLVNDYWFADGKLVYSTSAGQESVDLDRIDMQKTLDVNAKRGLVFTLRPALPAEPATSPSDQSAPPTQNQGAAPPEPSPNPAPSPAPAQP